MYMYHVFVTSFTLGLTGSQLNILVSIIFNSCPYFRLIVMKLLANLYFNRFFQFRTICNLVFPFNCYTLLKQKIQLA